MQNRHLIGTIIAAVLVIALVVILAASYFILKNYVVMGWQLFPRNRASLDLRDRAITLEEHDTLGWRMPGTQILWSVPLSGGYFDSDSQEITVTQFQPSDVAVLAYLPDLKPRAAPITAP